MRPRASIILIGMVALSGCFHATVDTGVAPSEQVVEKRWASSWIGGLVPPSTVATAAQCTTGVSKVETKLSFLNQLVSVVTLSIYTPMAIRVTCAEGVAGVARVAGAAGAAGVEGVEGVEGAPDQSAAADAPILGEAMP